MEHVPGVDLLVAIDVLDDLIHSARPVPLTRLVRLEQEDLTAAISDIRSATSAERIPFNESREFLLMLDGLERLAAEAPQIPFTSQIRCDREAIYDQLDQLRRNFPKSVQENRWKLAEAQAIAERGETEGRRLIEEQRRTSDASTELLGLVERITDPFMGSRGARQLTFDQTDALSTLDRLRALVPRAVDPSLPDRQRRVELALSGLDEAARLLGRASTKTSRAEARLSREHAGDLIDVLYERVIEPVLRFDRSV